MDTSFKLNKSQSDDQIFFEEKINVILLDVLENSRKTFKESFWGSTYNHEGEHWPCQSL